MEIDREREKDRDGIMQGIYPTGVLKNRISSRRNGWVFKTESFRNLDKMELRAVLILGFQLNNPNFNKIKKPAAT